MREPEDWTDLPEQGETRLVARKVSGLQNVLRATSDNCSMSAERICKPEVTGPLVRSIEITGQVAGLFNRSDSTAANEMQTVRAQFERTPSSQLSRPSDTGKTRVRVPSPTSAGENRPLLSAPGETRR